MEFHAPVGTTVLTGDSGTGKTTLLLAICWVIYGSHGSGPHRAVKVQSSSGHATTGVIIIRFGADIIVFGRTGAGQKLDAPLWIPEYARRELQTHTSASTMEFIYVNGIMVDYATARGKYFGTHAAFTATTIVPQKLPSLLLSTGKLSQTIENLFFPDTGPNSPAFYTSAIKDEIQKNNASVQLAVGKCEAMMHSVSDAISRETRAVNAMFNCALASNPQFVSEYTTTPDPVEFAMKCMAVLAQFQNLYDVIYSDMGHGSHFTIPTSPADESGIVATISLGTRAIMNRNENISKWRENNASIVQMKNMLPNLEPLRESLDAATTRKKCALNDAVAFIDDSARKTPFFHTFAEKRDIVTEHDVESLLEAMIIKAKSLMHVAAEQQKLHDDIRHDKIIHETLEAAYEDLSQRKNIVSQHARAREVLLSKGLNACKNTEDVHKMIYAQLIERLFTDENIERVNIHNDWALKITELYEPVVSALNEAIAIAANRSNRIKSMRNQRVRDLEQYYGTRNVIISAYNETVRTAVDLQNRAIDIDHVSLRANMIAENHKRTAATEAINRARESERNAKIHDIEMQRSNVLASIALEKQKIDNDARHVRAEMTNRMKMTSEKAKDVMIRAEKARDSITAENDNLRKKYELAVEKYNNDMNEHRKIMELTANAESTIQSLEAELDILCNRTVDDPTLETTGDIVKCPKCHESLYLCGSQLRTIGLTVEEKSQKLAEYTEFVNKRTILRKRISEQNNLTAMRNAQLKMTFSMPAEPVFVQIDDSHITARKAYENCNAAYLSYAASVDPPIHTNSEIIKLTMKLDTLSSIHFPPIEKETCELLDIDKLAAPRYVTFEPLLPYVPEISPLAQSIVDFPDDIRSCMGTLKPRKACNVNLETDNRTSFLPVISISEIEWIFKLPPILDVCEVEHSIAALIARNTYHEHVKLHGNVKNMDASHISSTATEKLKTLNDSIKAAVAAETILEIKIVERDELMIRITDATNKLGVCPSPLTELEKMNEILPHVITYAKIHMELQSIKSMYDTCMVDRNSKVSYGQLLSSSLSMVMKARTAYIEESLVAICATVNDMLSKLFDGHLRYELTLDDKEALVASLNFNGRTNVSLSELSGGEIDRYSIAVTVAFARVRGNPFIAFDETLASLDPQRRKECINAIADALSDRPIIFVSHDPPQGLFDNQIDISTCIS
jgi:ABC-type lipoprotein export system ATPase subunit